jgi:hypothetical protein
MTMRSQAWLESLSDDERRASVFGLCYEKVRREHGQWGYKLWPERSNVIIATKALKTCATVVSWLDASGFEVTWREIHWQGYVKFVFDYLAPTTPMIGQLKNKKLLALYIQSAPQTVVEDVLSQDELLDLYRSALDPEVAKNGAWLSALGLREP